MERLALEEQCSQNSIECLKSLVKDNGRNLAPGNKEPLNDTLDLVMSRMQEAHSLEDDTE